MDGLKYDSLSSLREAVWRHVLSTHTADYRPQPYQQLAATHRAVGHEAEARKILIAQQDDRRERALRPGPGASSWQKFWLGCRRLGLRVENRLIGYGYRTWPAFIVVLGLAAAGGVAGFVAGHMSAGLNGHPVAFKPPTAVHPAADTCSSVELLGLGIRIPFLPPLGSSTCALDTSTTTGQMCSVAIWSLEVFGWAAATLAVAGYTGLVRRA